MLDPAPASSARARYGRRHAARALVEEATAELALGASVRLYELPERGGVQQRACEARLVDGQLQLRGVGIIGRDVGGYRLARVGFGAAPACVERLQRAGHAHLPPVAAPWRCFHFEALEQVGAAGSAAVRSEWFHFAAPTSRCARRCVVALMGMQLAARELSGGRYALLHKAAATRELLAVTAEGTIAVLARGSDLLVHEICETPGGNPRARTDFGWVSVISKGGRTLIAPAQGLPPAESLRPRPGRLLCDTAKMLVAALVPPGPFRWQGLRRVVASLLRQVARGARLHDANGSTAATVAAEGLPALQRGWEKLAPAEQRAAQTLGWSYSSWRRGSHVVPSWSSLHAVERRAAARLDVQEGGWEALRLEQVVRKARWKDGAGKLKAEWSNLDDAERDAALWLGWDRHGWDQGLWPVVCGLAWTELAQEEKEAASTLGWTAETWQEDRWRDGPQARSDAAVRVEQAAAAPLEDESGGCWLHLEKAAVVGLDGLEATAAGAPVFCRVWMNDGMVGETRALATRSTHGDDIEALRMQLLGLNLSALRKRAILAGIDEEIVEDAMDGEANGHPKQALVDLIVMAMPSRADVSTEEVLRAELSGLGLKALRRKAMDAGVSSIALEDTLDHEDPLGETLVVTMRAMLPSLAPITSANGLQKTLSIGDAGSRTPVEVVWNERLRLRGARAFPMNNTLRIELHVQLLDRDAEISGFSSTSDGDLTVGSAAVSPPSREELDSRLGQLAKRDPRLAATLSASNYKGMVEPPPVSRHATSSVPLLEEVTPDRKSKPTDDDKHEVEMTIIIGTLVLHSQGHAGFAETASSYALVSSEPGAVVDGSVRLWVTAPEETDALGQLAERRQRAAVARKLGTPIHMLTNEVQVTRASVSWAALVIHSIGADGSSVQVDAMVSKFGATTSDLQGVPLIVAEPFLADTTPLLNPTELVDAVVLCGRGGIPFAEKARRIQECGAAVVIFVNTENNPFCPMSSGNAPAGTDDDVLIPAVCIQKSAGEDAVARAQAGGATISLVLGDQGTRQPSTAAAVAGGSPPRTPAMAARSPSSDPPLSPSVVSTSWALAREFSMTLASPAKPTSLGDEKSRTPGWEERHDRRLDVFGQLRPLMQLLVSKHTPADGADGEPALEAVTESDVRMLARGLMPWCEPDRVVSACRLRCIDKTSAIPYPRSSNGGARRTVSVFDQRRSSPPKSPGPARTASEVQGYRGGAIRRRASVSGFGIDAVIDVFLSASFIPSTRDEWEHLTRALIDWERWVVRRCEVVKATLVFANADEVGTHKGTVRTGEQVEVLRCKKNSRGNVMSLVRSGETHEEGWVAAVKRNGAVLLVHVEE